MTVKGSATQQDAPTQSHEERVCSQSCRGGADMVPRAAYGVWAVAAHTISRAVEVRVVHTEEVVAVRRVRRAGELVVDVRQERVRGEVPRAVGRAPEVRDAQVLLCLPGVQQVRRELRGQPLEQRQVREVRDTVPVLRTAQHESVDVRGCERLCVTLPHTTDGEEHDDFRRHESLGTTDGE